MIKCILIDDEVNALEMMEWLLKTYCPEVEVVAMCNSAADGMEAIEKYNPDVIFLDIDMPKMNGFDMLEKIASPSFEIVFCTAYDQFAIKAFKYAALHYLLKPVDPEDLKATINRVVKRRTAPTAEQVSILLQYITKPADKLPKRIALTTGEGLTFVETDDIIYCKAESNYSNIILINGKKVMVSRVLKDIEETLNGNDFYRVHSSYLINIKHIKRYVRGDGGFVVMDNDEHITISRSRRQEFMDLFSRF